MTQDQFSEDQLSRFQTLVDIVERLRAPGGCPWDREQTHLSLKRNLLEECYEVLEAIDREDPHALSEELGDLLVQVAFHTQIASETGEFELADVLTHINRKLVRRHPHVFGDAKVTDAREVERNWERIKEAEKREDGVKKSPVDGIPKDLPALTYAQLMQDRVGRAGFEWEDISGVLDKLAEEVEELRQAASKEEMTAPQAVPPNRVPQVQSGSMTRGRSARRFSTSNPNRPSPVLTTVQSTGRRSPPGSTCQATGALCTSTPILVWNRMRPSAVGSTRSAPRTSICTCAGSLPAAQ